MAGARASSGRAPPLIRLMRRRRTVRRLALTGMMTLRMKGMRQTRAIYAL